MIGSRGDSNASRSTTTVSIPMAISSPIPLKKAAPESVVIETDEKLSTSPESRTSLGGQSDSTSSLLLEFIKGSSSSADSQEHDSHRDEKEDDADANHLQKKGIDFAAKQKEEQRLEDARLSAAIDYASLSDSIQEEDERVRTYADTDEGGSGVSALVVDNNDQAESLLSKMQRKVVEKIARSLETDFDTKPFINTPVLTILDLSRAAKITVDHIYESTVKALSTQALRPSKPKDESKSDSGNSQQDQPFHIIHCSDPFTAAVNYVFTHPDTLKIYDLDLGFQIRTPALERIAKVSLRKKNNIDPALYGLDYSELELAKKREAKVPASFTEQRFLDDVSKLKNAKVSIPDCIGFSQEISMEELPAITQCYRDNHAGKIRLLLSEYQGIYTDQNLLYMGLKPKENLSGRAWLKKYGPTLGPLSKHTDAHWKRTLMYKQALKHVNLLLINDNQEVPASEKIFKPKAVVKFTDKIIKPACQYIMAQIKHHIRLLGASNSALQPQPAQCHSVSLNSTGSISSGLACAANKISDYTTTTTVAPPGGAIDHPFRLSPPTPTRRCSQGNGSRSSESSPKKHIRPTTAELLGSYSVVKARSDGITTAALNAMSEGKMSMKDAQKFVIDVMKELPVSMSNKK